MATARQPSPATDTPWTAEPSGDGFFQVVNSKSVILAQKCVEEEAHLFAAAPRLLIVAHLALRALEQMEWEYDTVQHQAYVSLTEVIGEAVCQAT